MTRTMRDRVLHYILEDHAARQPDKPFVVTHERTLSYAETDALANRMGRGFAALGVGKGDRVMVMIPSGIDFMLVWLGLSRIGALLCPVNEAYMGRMLQHQARDAAAELALISHGHLGKWVEIAGDLPVLSRVLLYDDGAPAPECPWPTLPFDSAMAEDATPLPPVVAPRDPMAIFYTSGTTGPSKGVLYSHAQATATAAPQAAMCDPDDVFYMCAPMFHCGLPHYAGIPLIAGATLALRPRFSGTHFWDDVRRFGVTMTMLMSTMPAYLIAAPERADDADNPLKKAITILIPTDVQGFKRRFGIEHVATLYNMTEVSTPLCSDWDPPNTATCGRPRPGITARIVDANDQEVPVGEVGELVLRADDPWEFNLGYWRNPEKTVETWQNLWLHTGDLVSRDADGWFHFRDRMKDAIRRRGENISSFEIEREMDAHPDVLESAAVAVPSVLGEDEVKVVATARPGSGLTAKALAAHLDRVLPRYMHPRYVEVRAEELPKTPTGKIQKAELRVLGAGVWDREAV